MKQERGTKMSKIVEVRNVKLGEGRPKICIPLTDKKIEALLASAEKLKSVPCDLVEWRGDFFEEVEDASAFNAAAKALREALGDMPILFTIRTAAEGGNMAVSGQAYADLNLTAIESGMVDLVDLEICRGEDVAHQVVSAAHAKGVKVVGSRHDFDKTPEKSFIVENLVNMQQVGCDVAKFAVMPRSERDVLTLLDATLTMKEEHAETPVITMSMGPMGAVSRVCGSLFGSALTFGTAGAASAPGQLPADILDSFLKAF